MKDNRRRWNNILILSVIVFILMLNLPQIIKTYLIEDTHPQHETLLNPNYSLQAINFATWQLDKKDGQWQISRPSHVTASELVERWHRLVGTEIDEKTYLSLKPSLGMPETIEVWYQGQNEPQRITFYTTPKFLLLKNWKDKWIAITVSNKFLFP
ncbi:hypothetical protein L4C34_07165 [Vibrio profundum]